MKNNQTMLFICVHPSEALTISNMEVGGRHRMVVGFITTYAISAYHH